MIRVGLIGSRGRMGEWIAKLLLTEFTAEAQLSAAVDRGDPIDGLFQCDVVIDFSSPEAMKAAASSALARAQPGPAWVIGSTGWSPQDRTVIESLAQRAPVLMSSNFSMGVLALAEILRHAAPILKRLGYAPVQVEAHHRHKKDAPSGTALLLQRVIDPDSPGSVQTHSIRAGEVIGDHEVTFYSAGDQISLGHFAQDRSIFARGAIQGALWLAEKRGQFGAASGTILTPEVFFREKFAGLK